MTQFLFDLRFHQSFFWERFIVCSSFISEDTALKVPTDVWTTDFPVRNLVCISGCSWSSLCYFSRYQVAYSRYLMQSASQKTGRRSWIACKWPSHCPCLSAEVRLWSMEVKSAKPSQYLHTSGLCWYVLKIH